MAQARMTFPPDFLWGTATSSHQVEGNNVNNDWWAWEQNSGRFSPDNRSGLAGDWWNNAEQDLDAAAEMGTSAHRFSLEWSRIEPEPGYFDAAAIERYRAILIAMRQRDIEPMVTLHHFSNPLWLVEKGDFNSEIVVDHFQRYAAKVADTLGDLIPKWITINEPMVYMAQRYLSDAFPPPAQRGYRAGLQAARRMLYCHAAAYHAIKERCPEAQVGVAKNMLVFAPRLNGNLLDGWWTGRVDRIFNDYWLEGATTGRLKRPLGAGHAPQLANTLDFIGLNYYTRFRIKFPLGKEMIARDWGPDAIVSDNAYGEVYPEGLFAMIKRVLRYKKPIYITGNGLPDKEDRLRPSFILHHLRHVWQAVSFCFPVYGYYHWSLIDSFEWQDGWNQRFGLIALDPATQARHWRPGAHLYREICRSRSVSSEMAEQYAPDALETLFRGTGPGKNNG